MFFQAVKLTRKNAENNIPMKINAAHFTLRKGVILATESGGRLLRR
jgi:hypothetical protein